MVDIVMKKTYIYAGSRSHVLEGLLKSLGPNEFSILALENSFLETYCINKILIIIVLSEHGFWKIKNDERWYYFHGMFYFIRHSFKINIDNYRDIIFLNIHPSLLPILKGRDPAIGALFHNLLAKYPYYEW